MGFCCFLKSPLFVKWVMIFKVISMLFEPLIRIKFVE